MHLASAFTVQAVPNVRAAWHEGYSIFDVGVPGVTLKAIWTDMDSKTNNDILIALFGGTPDADAHPMVFKVTTTNTFKFQGHLAFTSLLAFVYKTVRHKKGKIRQGKTNKTFI